MSIRGTNATNSITMYNKTIIDSLLIQGVGCVLCTIKLLTGDSDGSDPRLHFFSC